MASIRDRLIASLNAAYDLPFFNEAQEAQLFTLIVDNVLHVIPGPVQTAMESAGAFVPQDVLDATTARVALAIHDLLFTLIHRLPWLGNIVEPFAASKTIATKIVSYASVGSHLPHLAD